MHVGVWKIDWINRCIVFGVEWNGNDVWNLVWRSIRQVIAQQAPTASINALAVRQLANFVLLQQLHRESRVSAKRLWRIASGMLENYIVAAGMLSWELVNWRIKFSLKARGISTKAVRDSFSLLVVPRIRISLHHRRDRTKWSSNHSLCHGSMPRQVIFSGVRLYDAKD